MSWRTQNGASSRLVDSCQRAGVRVCVCMYVCVSVRARVRECVPCMLTLQCVGMVGRVFAV